MSQWNHKLQNRILWIQIHDNSLLGLIYVVMYKPIIDAWCKSSGEIAFYKAEEMLEWIEKNYENNGKS